MANRTERFIYQIKITLKRIKPPVWRRLLVPSDINLGILHHVVQSTMGWTDSHLHQFVHEDISFTTLYEDLDYRPNEFDEHEHSLCQLLKKTKDSINYEYDYGDGWDHEIVLEKILPWDDPAELPRCVAGRRSCPPEDCGGPWGYTDLLKIIKDPSHEYYEEKSQWLGPYFDPEAFSVEETNEFLEAYREKSKKPKRSHKRMLPEGPNNILLMPPKDDKETTYH